MNISISQLIPILTTGIVMTTVTAIISFITMLNSSKIEKIFFTTEKRLAIQISNVALVSIPIALFSVWVYTLFKPLKEVDPEHQLELFIAYFLVFYITSVFFVGYLYGAFFSDLLGRYAFYIEHDFEGKMYVVKSMNKKEVILYNKPRLYNTLENSKYYIITREELKEYTIFQEKMKNTGFLDVIKILIKKIFKRN